MKRNLIYSISLALAITAQAQTIDPMADTWVCDDGLGRPVLNADDDEVGKYKTTKTIGMFYYLWHGQHDGFKKDVSVLVHENPDNPAWDAEGTFHWGSKPLMGYYVAGNQYVIAKHMQMLVDAGIDFYFFDVTNAFYYSTVVRKVMDEIDRRTALGLKSPKLCFMLNAHVAQTLKNIYNDFYANPDNDKYWFYYDGKPLVMCSPKEGAEYADKFTFRRSWAWMKGANAEEWAWLEYYPQAPGWHIDKYGNRKNEQISVSAAQHATTKVGKSYHNGRQPAIDKYGLCKETPQGLYFQEQWNRALEVSPKICMITQWNEWAAQRCVIKNQNNFGDVRPGATAKIGETYFVDVYNEEFSRDIEPSSSPLIRDNYYLQMVSNIRRYRGAHPLPVPTANLSIDVNGDWSQWDAETLEYIDEPGDCVYTYSKAIAADAMERATNDIVKAKVTKDGENVYFYVATADETLVADNGKSMWMHLFLNTDRDYATGWAGYDYMIVPGEQSSTLYKNKGNEYAWEKCGAISSRIEGNKIMLGVPAKSLGWDNTDKDFDFKWADNVSVGTPDVMRFITDGDAAPNGRFNYRFKGASLPVAGLCAPEAKQLDVMVERLSADTVRVVFPFAQDANIEAYNIVGEKCAVKEVSMTTAAELDLRNGFYLLHYNIDNTTGVLKIAY